MKSDPTFWLLARATGIVAYALLTVSVLAGLLVKSRPFGTKIKPALAVDTASPSCSTTPSRSASWP